LGASLSDAIFDQGAQDLWQQYEAIAGHKPMAPQHQQLWNFCVLCGGHDLN